MSGEGDGLPGDWRGLVVFCAGTAWNGNRFPDQHMAERLARRAPVLYVDPPISLLTPRRHPELASTLEGARLRIIQPSLARLTPMVIPAFSRAGLRVVAEVMHRRAIKRAVRALGGDVAALVVAAPVDVMTAVPAKTKVLYATDDFASGGSLMGVSTRWLKRTERRQVAALDVVVAVSPHLERKWLARGLQPVLIPNGVDEALFAETEDAPLPSDVELEPPVAGFIGHLSDRIDLSLLEAVAEAGHSLLLVGPRQRTFAADRIKALIAKPNVQWVGPKPFRELPGYLRAMKVGLLPYADSEFNRSSFPLKLLEYLAGGRPVVATDLPAVRYLGTDLIALATSPADFEAAVASALTAEPDPVDAARRQALAADHSWDKRAGELASVLGLSHR